MTLAEILDELAKNTRDYASPRLETVRNKTKRDLENRDRVPTRPHFLATWLSQDRGYIDNWVRTKLRNRGLGDIARWHDTDRNPPTRKDRDDVWRAWVTATISANFWPTAQELQHFLSPAQLEFREEILTVEVAQADA